MDYIISHTTIGLDIKTLIALVLLIAFTIFFVYMNRKMKKEEKELEDELS